jgi:hypothetical protein
VKRSAFLVRHLALSAAIQVLVTTPASAWWDQNWTRRVKLTFLNGGQAENLTSFPVLVRLDGSRISYADTENAGQDVRFVDSDDLTPLAYEIERWDESGSSYLWVNVPQIDMSSNADFIWMYYGNATAADAQNPDATWDASYRGVWHLDEDPSVAGASGIVDSSGAGNHGTDFGAMDAADSVPGRAGRGVDFDGVDDGVALGDPATLDFGAAQSFTYSAWVHVTATVGAWDSPFSKGGTNASNPGYDFELGTTWQTCMADGAAIRCGVFGTGSVTGRWVQVAAVVDRGLNVVRRYVDGAFVNQTALAPFGSPSTATEALIGATNSGCCGRSNWFRGIVDEVRVEAALRSDAWVRAQHLSMSDAFVSFGAPTPSGVMRVKSGSYAGNGADDRAIFVGFQPDVVFIKRDAACGACGNPEDFIGVVRTSTMIGDATKSLDNLTGLALFASGVKSLTATGFSLGTSARVNAAAETYHWVAFQAAPGALKVGTYTGTGPDNRSVTGVGFQPEFVITLPAAGGAFTGFPWFRSSTMPPDRAYDCDANGVANKIQIMEADGFQVGSEQNLNAADYHYVAWNAVPGAVAVGSYAGTGVDPTDYDVVGFRPEWLLIKQDASIRPWVHKPASTGISSPYQLAFSEFSGVADNILALRPSGFRVDDHERVNSLGNTYHWIAFGPHAQRTNLRSIGETAVNYGTGPGATSGNGTTVSVTSGSNVVTGVGGTAWTTANRGRGDAITIPCSDPPTCTGGVHYTIGQVTTQTSLLLTDGYQGATNGSISYLIRRQFATPSAWENCIDGGGTPCGLFPSVNASLVADDRSEVGIVYEDFVYTGPLNGVLLTINGATTDALHTITLTADGQNRHYGIPGDGVRFQLAPTSSSGDLIEIHTRFVTVEWIEFAGDRAGADAVEVTDTGNAGKVVVRNNLIQNVGAGIQLADALADVDVYNNIIYRPSKEGIAIDPGVTSRILNNTIYDAGQEGIYGDPVAPTYPNVVLRNNLVHTTVNSNYSVPGLNPASSHNLSSDATATTHSPAGGGRPSVPLSGGGGVNFVDPLAANKDLHLLGTSFAIDKAADASGIFGIDVDFATRATPWDIGADDAAAAVPTAVELVFLQATGSDQAVTLRWETASEIDNLGFHVHRALSPEGPYERITDRLIPGRGSSPEGARYRWVDSALENGTEYFYKLEDVETTGATEVHGPVSATPSATSELPGTNLITYGSPEATGFRVVSRTSSELVVELTTEGFHAEPRDDGSVRLAIPGFSSFPGSPSVPVLRPWVSIPSGRAARIVSAEPAFTETFEGLRPSGAESHDVEARPGGTVLARKGASARPLGSTGLVPTRAARIAQTGFQGGAKKIQLELAPLRWDGTRGALLLTRRLTVRIALGGHAPERPAPRHSRRGSVVRLSVTDAGLHEVRFEDLFGGGRRTISALRLSRLGVTVPHHLEPPGRPFGPGSRLYFWSEGPRINPYGRELVYEIELTEGGKRIAVESSIPEGSDVRHHLATASYEENRYYQAALLDAEDRWLWDVLLAPVSKSYPFHVTNLSAGTAGLRVRLQGASDFDSELDHHVKLGVNGVALGEAAWDGKSGRSVEAEIPEGVLREGENRIEIENAGDTGAPYSMIMLDRFEVVYPRSSIANEGEIEGQWMEGGTATVDGMGGAYVLDLTDAEPRWVESVRVYGGAVRFPVEAGRKYAAVSKSSVRRPTVRRAPAPRLTTGPLRADYLVIGPRELSPAAAPLLEHRRREGLTPLFVSTEDIFGEFGFGEARPEAVRDWIAYAYHHGREPRLRYVLLLGDATYDFKDYLRTGVENRVPPLMVKTSYLWTASDPAYAAVHGEDLLPDLAVGRIPAANAEEARVVIGKILAYEQRQDAPGAFVLVTDNSDGAGDFEANAEEIARGPLAGRTVRRISLAEFGGATRSEILSALDQGPSLVSYIGHGGIHLWADENVFNVSDVPALAPEPRQPLLLTMNCLNGYFHFPYFDSLAESLLEAEGKGAIAAFSPSGLSLDGPAHRLHLDILEAVVSGRHTRLGDAVLKAQSAYAESGSFPELLAIYNLLGDPALRLR